jgi:hypothetical protein
MRSSRPSLLGLGSGELSGTGSGTSRAPLFVGFSDDRRLVVSVVLVFVLKTFFVFVVIGVSRRHRIAHDYRLFHNSDHPA